MISGGFTCFWREIINITSVHDTSRVTDSNCVARSGCRCRNLGLPMQVISFLRSLARYGSPGLSPASGFEHPASTLPTRFPAALDIGHGLRYARSYCIRSSTRRCLSMLRNTRDGNELALPLPMPMKRSIVLVNGIR